MVMAGFERVAYRLSDNLGSKDILEKVVQRVAGRQVSSRKCLFDVKVFGAKIEDAVTLFPITASSADLLTIFFDGVWDIPVDNVANVFVVSLILRSYRREPT